MKIEQTLENVIKVDRENIELEAKIESLKDQIRQNHKRLIEDFFPYLLSVYEKWRPRLEEKAMAIYFGPHICFEVTIKEINGYMVRAQEGQKANVLHRFELNPVLDEYEVPCFILPKWSYDEIKDFFEFEFLK